MIRVPKRVGDRFVRSVAKFQKVLQMAKDRDVNESDTVTLLNDMFAEVFGYDKYTELTSEVAIRGSYCDLGLKVNDKPEFLVEAKAIGLSLKENHIRQAIDYGANHGVQWIILTNAIEWRLYRIRFEQPVNFDLIFSFNLLELNLHGEREQEMLLAIAKEGLADNVREEIFEKGQTLNRFVLGGLILGDVVLASIKKELRRLSGGIRVEVPEIAEMLKRDVLKREVVEGEGAEAAQTRVNKFYRKASRAMKKKAETGGEATKSSDGASGNT